jgi:hypothetical protein
LIVTEPRCLLCEGVCPLCGGVVGEPAGSENWILCSLCHATFRHTKDDHAPSEAGDESPEV